MAITATDRQALLAKEGCPWAEFTERQLYLALNDTFSRFGFAFGYGSFRKDEILPYYRGAEGSPLAAAISNLEAIKPDYEVRVTPGLEALVAKAIEALPASSWDGYAFDVFHMSRTGWEFCAGDVLFGCRIGGQLHWIVSGLMDPGHWSKKEWITFGLAGEELADPSVIPHLDEDAIAARAFGESED